MGYGLRGLGNSGCGVLVPPARPAGWRGLPKHSSPSRTHHEWKEPPFQCQFNTYTHLDSMHMLQYEDGGWWALAKDRWALAAPSDECTVT